MGLIIFKWSINSGALSEVQELKFHWGVPLFKCFRLFQIREVGDLVNKSYMIGYYDLMLIQPQWKLCIIHYVG